jgi:Sulfotransferase domain
MKVIGAGLPRTATLTQKVALEMLGFEPCYHMVNVLGDLDNVPRWQEALEGRSEWDDIFGQFQASVDWPGAFFYRDLMEAYPEAKVLLSVRDAEAWERSMGETIWGIFYGDMLIHDLSTAWSRVDSKWASYIALMKSMWQKSGLLGVGQDGPGSGSMARAMERYNHEVINTVPADRLLVWSPGDGWGPLCEFLGVGVPEVPVPHINDAKQFGDRIVDAAVAALNRWREQEMPVGADR